MRNYAYVAGCKRADDYIQQLMDDPMTIGTGAPMDDIIDGWMRNHIRACEQCREATQEANMP